MTADQNPMGGASQANHPDDPSNPRGNCYKATDDMRREFEAWATSKSVPIERCPDYPNEYKSAHVQGMWGGWKACCATRPVPAGVVEKLGYAIECLDSYITIGFRQNQLASPYEVVNAISILRDIVKAHPQPAVSLDDCLKRVHDYMRKLPESGAELKEVIKCTLDYVGVAYVD